MDDAVTFTGRPREEVQKIMDELDKIRIVKSIKGVFFAV
jgi:hypothetical protein